MNPTENIKQKAIELGFDVVGITDASPIDAKQAELLAKWLESGCAGQMSYMHNNFEKRIAPAKLLENAKSVICVGLNCTTPNPKKQFPTTARTGKVASFAQYEDYHLFIKKQLRKLSQNLSSVCESEVRFKICVDSVPLAERALAVRAGIGFIGKNHMLINPKLGCQILLGEIITDVELQADERIGDECSSCDKCIAACATGALGYYGRFDANKCISYLTIEHKGEIASGLAEKIGGRIFGCDDCIMACPYQENAPVCKNKQFKFYGDKAELNLREVLDLTAEKFDVEFADTCFERAGLEKLKTNARICLANIRAV